MVVARHGFFLCGCAKHLVKHRNFPIHASFKRSLSVACGDGYADKGTNDDMQAWLVDNGSPDSSFNSLGVDRVFSRKLRLLGIMKPTTVQCKAIPSVIAGKNVVINAETGSGKTLAYALPLLQQVLNLKRSKHSILPRPHTLVIVPGMELAHQVASVFRSLLSAVHLDVALVDNNAPLRISPTTTVLVATAQSLSNYKLDYFADTQVLVVDEVDAVIMRRKKDPIVSIMNFFTSNDTFRTAWDQMQRQFVFAGATMPERGEKTAVPLIRSWVGETFMIQTDATHHILSNIDLEFYRVEDGNKTKQLVACIGELLNAGDTALKIIVFVNTLNTAKLLHKQIAEFTPTNYDGSRLISYSDGVSKSAYSDYVQFCRVWGDNVSVIHKDVPLSERLRILETFSLSHSHMLITTDATARGLDLPNVDVVVQYDVATNIINILHRAGRTGRMGKQGKVISFVTERDEVLCDTLRHAAKRGVSLEPFFSRRRSLRKNIDRGVVTINESISTVS